MREARIRKLHRIATLIIGAQLVIWTVTGFAFSWFDFERVRGASDRAPAPELATAEAKVGIAEAVAAAGGRAVSVELRPLLGRATWLVKRADGSVARVDAADGKVLPPLDEAQARAVALAAHRGSVGIRAVDSLPSAPDLDEPVFRVRLDDARQTEVFVSPSTGAVLAWRNADWRSFDRLWSLHVLGWAKRDNPAHPAMRVAGALAVTVSLSGVGLLLASLRRRRRVEARP